MNVTGKLETIFFSRKSCKVKKKFNQCLLTLLTFLLWISPGLGDDKPPSNCKAQDFGFCSSSCAYVRNKCGANKDCSIELCSYLYPICRHQLNCPRFLSKCWNLFSECTEALFQTENKLETKRSILNKNVAYLLLKLHPILNQTSQSGFLPSGRFRRIGSTIGTEFLGKRSNKNKSRSSGGRDQPKIKPSPSPTFYSLPLNKFSKTKILKRSFLQELKSLRDKKTVGGNGRVILGSEFLGKRREELSDERTKRLVGNEFLGKRDYDDFESRDDAGYTGNELLGKRNLHDTDTSGAGTELLGKKDNREGIVEALQKRFGNELLGKRQQGNELLGKRILETVSKGGIWLDYDPELIDEAFSNYRTFPEVKFNSKAVEMCDDSNEDSCKRLKVQGNSE